MEFAIEGIFVLCAKIYDSAINTSTNIFHSQDLADHVKGIEKILVGIQQDTQKDNNSSSALLHSLEYLRGALDRANDVMERYGKRGRILRYVLAAKVKDEFESTFQQIDQALQQLGAINLQLNAESRKEISELSGRVHQMSFNLTQDMQNINNKINLLFKQQEKQQQSSSLTTDLNSKVQEIILQIPGENSQREHKCDIEDLEEEMKLAIAEKNQVEAFMIEQIIEVIQEQQRLKPQLQEIPSELMCPITQQVMTDPVIVPQTGQTYEKSAIEHWFQRGNLYDPCTQMELPEPPNFIKNYAIKRAIEKYNDSAKTLNLDTLQDLENNSNNNDNNFHNDDNNNNISTIEKSSMKWRRVCMWVTLNIVFICIVVAVSTAFMFAGKNSKKRDIEGESNLYACSLTLNQLECDKQVLKKLIKRKGDPCHDWENTQCKERVYELWNMHAFKTIPIELSRLNGLRALDLTGSNFTGQVLPSEWSQLTAMENFRAPETFLSGTLPPEYSTWSRSEYFYAGGNYLKGLIPEQYSTFENILEFGVARQNLQGSLSPQFSTWKKIQNLYLYENFLAGTLPPQFSNWGETPEIRIRKNHFQGCVPEEFSVFNGFFSVENCREFKSNLCVQKSSVLIEMYYYNNTDNTYTGDLDQVLKC